MTKHLGASLWHNRDYLLLLGGQTISSIGTGVSQLAFPLLILALTHSPAQAGLIGALQSLPYFFLSLPLGVLVDRWNRKWVMIICDTGRALNLLSIPLISVVGKLSPLQLSLNSLIEGVFFVAFNLAETASLTNVVSPDQLPTAMAQDNAAEGVTTVLGPPLGGMLYSVGQTLPFLSDAISYLVSVVSLLFIRTAFHTTQTRPSRRFLEEMSLGFQWLWRHRLVRTMTFLTSTGLFVQYGITLTVIVLAQHLHLSSASIGVLFAAGGVSMVGGSLLTPLLQRTFRFGQVFLAVSWGQALLWLLLAVVSTPLLLVGVIIGLYFLDPIGNVLQMSTRLALIPKELQGRVTSIVRLCAFSMRALGLACTGLLLQVLGTTWTIVLGATVLGLLALVATFSVVIRQAESFLKP